MSFITFDTLKMAEKLMLAGMPGEQAKALVEAWMEAMQINSREWVTKRDLNEVEARIESKIDKLDAKIGKTEASLNGEIILLKWMMGFVLAGIAALIIRSFF